MSFLNSKLRIKVCFGEGENEIIKTLSSFPSDFNDLYAKTLKRLSDRLNSIDEKIYIYYHDDYNGKIQIEDDSDLTCAIEHCNLLSLKSLKLYVYTCRLEKIERSRIVLNDQNHESGDKLESEEEEDEKEESDDEPSCNE